MSSNPSRTLVLLAAACAALALAPGCGCNPTPVTPDAGADDAGFDAGEVDAGFDAGEPDAGEDAGPPPELKIFKVLPPRGGTAGGTQVLITGQGFVRGFATRATEAKKVTSLKFGLNPSQDFQVIDDNTIDARVPAGKAGLANLSITNGNGLFVCTGCFSYYDELYLTGVNPKQGPLRGGNEVVLDGQGFSDDVHVLFGSQSSPSVTLVSSKQLKVQVPRALAADSVDVTVYNKNGVGSQRRVYRYVEDLGVTEVAPRFGPLAGGTQVVLTGQGFEGASAVKFGALPAASFTVDSDTQLTAVSPPGAIAGAVDLSIDTPRDSVVVRSAFAYVDGSSTALFALSPRLGPAAGGNTVTLVGQGLDLPGLTVSFGGAAVGIVSQSANQVVVTAPARGGAARKLSVTASDGTTGTTLTDGYTYRLELVSLAPSRGPSTGGTAATLTGANLPADALVFVGSLAATVNGAPTETLVQLTTPKGSGGAPNDVRVREAADPENEALLPAAFTFDEPLSLGRVQPERGAIAGGTLVTVRGAGFGAATVVKFGANHAKDVKVVDGHTLTCRTPKGDVGSVDVGLERLGQSDLLPGGFSYFDPRNISGGLSGGPLVGTLNVSVMDGTMFGLPVPLANVILGLDGNTPFQGQTDSRGQLTFSDPSLVKAQTVTVWKEGYESTTVTAVASENLTVFIDRTGGEGSPSPQPGAPPSLISGRVTGFKAPHALNANESLEARVFVSQSSFYYGPPLLQLFFGADYLAGLLAHSGEKWLVVQDGGEYLLYSGAGLHATYAILGVKNTQTGAFTPYLMGIRRSITTSPDNPAVNQDIILDMHLDLTVPITIDSPLNIGKDIAGNPLPAVNEVYSWLDLGAEGFIPNPNNWGTGTTGTSSVSSTLANLSFPSFPQLDGSNFVFLDFAAGAQGIPLSFFFRRQPGNLAGGVTIGPMAPGPTPDLHRVQIIRPNPMGPATTVWTVVLPGSETQVVLPPQALQQLREGEAGRALYVQITSTRSPKFSYSQWTYDALTSVVGWSSFTIALSDTFSP
ncbi:MAG: IPT/TIG domain-containing protein [Myxococcaceae bacterium]